MVALIRTRAAVSEMKRLFGATAEGPLAWPESIWPGDLVPVVTGGVDGRQLSVMHWGLPQAQFRQPRPPAQRGVIYTRDLVANASRLAAPAMLARCLIVIESFARPSGETGRCTRLWSGLWDTPLAAWAGLCVPGGTYCTGLVHAARGRADRAGSDVPCLLDPAQWQPWLEGAGPLSIGPGPGEDSFYREQLDELWASGRWADDAEERRAA